MNIYYAHCIAIYNTKQEERDIDILKKLFPNADIYNPNSQEAQEGYKLEGMDYFYKKIDECDIVTFRALPNGKIPAGVYKEIEYAKDKPVIELPCFTGRIMSVEDTRFFLNEIGFR